MTYLIRATYRGNARDDVVHVSRLKHYHDRVSDDSRDTSQPAPGDDPHLLTDAEIDNFDNLDTEISAEEVDPDDAPLPPEQSNLISSESVEKPNTDTTYHNMTEENRRHTRCGRSVRAPVRFGLSTFFLIFSGFSPSLLCPSQTLISRL